MASNFRKKILINLALSFGIVIAILAAIYFLGSDISQRTKLILGLKRELTFRTKVIESFVLLKEEASRAAGYENQLENLLPTQDELINFPRQARALAQDNRITLGFNFGAQSQGIIGKPGFIDFEMTTGGQLNDFINFLRSLEAGNYFISFSNLEINQANITYSSKLVGKVFSRD